LPGEFPTIASALQHAIQHHQTGQLQAAETIYRQILHHQPNHLDALNLLGVLTQQIGQPDVAIELLQRAIALQPNHVHALYNLGVVLQEQGKWDAAIDRYRQVLHWQPMYRAALGNLGWVLRKQGNWDDAVITYRRLVQLQPDLAEAHSGLAIALREQGHWDDAISHHQQALQLKPEYAEAHISLGVTLQAQGKLEEAIASYQTALQRQPNSPEAHYNLATALLLTGAFRQGFAEYEWRWQVSSRLPHSPFQRFSQPLWDGSALAGQTILLHAEQGLGDTIQFSRYAPLVAAQGGRVIVECQPALARLLQSIAGVEQVVSQGNALPDFQVHAPLLSLPHLLDTTLDTIPAQVPYLAAPDSAIHVADSPAISLKVGIVWASGHYGQPESTRMQHQKSCSLALFSRLLQVPEVCLYSLQVGQDAWVEDIDRQNNQKCQLDRTRLQDLSPDLHDFGDTAAAIAQMDLVISVDTAVAHLAGALGKPVWLLLPFIPDWRWLLDRDDSPWYPTMRLFRQSQPGDWDGLFDRILATLKQQLPTHSTSSPLSVSIPYSLPSVASPPLSALLPQAVQQHQTGQFQAAAALYRQILQQQPEHLNALHLLGVLSHQIGQPHTAIALLKRAIDLQPNFVEALCNLGIVVQEQGLVDEAIAYYQRAVQCQPNSPEAHYNLADALLLTGNLVQGFQEYEWRWQTPQNRSQSPVQRFSQPTWDGSDLSGQTILLHAEQGFGDTIQFIRYVPFVAACGGRVIVECQPALVRLLQAIAGIEEVLSQGALLPPFDWQAPLLSLPRLLNTTLETIPAQVPYLTPPPSLLQLPKSDSSLLKIGIVWASGYQAQPGVSVGYHKKSCPLSMFMRLLAIPEVSLYSLQIGQDAADLRFCRRESRVQDLSCQIHDFGDTAAAIAQMDLVISVDTAVAHLAGALGKPVWLLLPFAPDWRWLLHRDDSPWYPTMRLFRQPQPGDWEQVLAHVVESLHRFTIKR
jgi:tetratricopeptide (TPR) repeat protein